MGDKTEYQRAWRAKNREKVAAAKKRYAEKHPEKIKEMNREYRKKNLEVCRARERAYQLSHLETRRVKNQEYRLQNLERIRATNREYMRGYRQGYQDANSEKTEARSKVNVAIRTGKLIRQLCWCGKVGEAHHEDYTKAYQIVWLCRKHHAERHRKHVAECQIP